MPLSFYVGMTGLVVFAFITQNLMTRAVYLKKASYIMPFGYFAIVLACIVDTTIFGNHLDFLAYIGILLTSSGLLSKLVVKEE